MRRWGWVLAAAGLAVLARAACGGGQTRVATFNIRFYPESRELSSEKPSRISARGPCETDGCEPAERCPRFHEQVSDHCPVVAEL